MPRTSSKHDARRSARPARAALRRERFGGIPLSLVRRYRNRLAGPAVDGRAPAGPSARHSTA
jgi:hypothetical protein